MILNALVEKLKRRAKHDFRGRHFEASLILQAVAWYLRYPLSYRDIEELFLERGLAVDHSTLNRWVLAYAPLIERRLRAFRKPHCGSIRIDETYIKIRGQWRYLYRAIDKHGVPVDFLLTATRDLKAAKRFFRKVLKNESLLAPDRIGTDGAGPYPPAIAAARNEVAPVWWTPMMLLREVSLWPRPIPPMRRSFGAKWSSWCVPGVIRPIWLANSNPRPRRSATGWPRPIGRTAAERPSPL